LKNEGVLPLGPDVKIITVIGGQAATPTVHGGGSGSVEGPYVSAPLDAIRARVALPPAPPVSNNCSDGNFETDMDFYNQNSQTSAGAASVDECCALCGARSSCHAFTFVGGTCWMKANDEGRRGSSGAVSGICKKGDPPPSTDCKDGICVHFNDGTDTAAAASLASTADAVLIFVGTTSSEGGDRADLTLAEEDDLINAVAAAAGSKAAVIAVTPGALLTPWRDEVSAILIPFMPGQEYGNAIMDVVFGDVNPSAKLPITFPKIENEVGFAQEQYPGKNGVSLYSEGLEVGYRWYAAHGVEPAFPFGHGLSYTNFEYNDLAVEGYTVSCQVKNAGLVDGAEVVQLYLGFPEEAGEPPKVLKQFQRVTLSSGETATVSLQLDDMSFSIWDTKVHDWAVVPGEFKVMVGSSSGDIRLNGSLTSGGVLIV